MKVAANKGFSNSPNKLVPLSLVLVYAFLISLSLYLAYSLRFDFEIPTGYRRQFLLLLLLIVPLKLFFLLVFGQFRQILSYFSIPDLTRIFYALCSASFVLLFSWLFVDHQDWRIPRGVILADLLFSLVFMVGFRTAIRLWNEKKAPMKVEKSGRVAQKRLGIFGAGSAGASLASELLSKPYLGLVPVVFLDDDINKIGKKLHGIPVLNASEPLQNITEKYGFSRLAIAMPSIRASRIKEVVSWAAEAKVETNIVPSLHDLSTGRVRIEELRQVRVEDVLGRDPVDLDDASIARLVTGKTVWVTGAGGSIGSEIARQVLALDPAKLVLLDHSEAALFEIQFDLLRKDMSAPLQLLVADAGDRNWMRINMRQHKPDIVFYAAAYKHVHLMELQPWQALRNNTIHFHHFAEMMAEAGVAKLVLISTDKAIRPNSVMGASKRLAEWSMLALQQKYPNTKMISVRFGNVLESSGSVIPIFRRQIAEGGPVTVTDPEATRYFMTIPEAVGLVLQATFMGQGNEVFVLNMGDPVRILDLARQMIQLSGFVPDKEICIIFTGLRPGEKLHEELDSHCENIEPTAHPRIWKYRVENTPLLLQYEPWILSLEKDLNDLSSTDLKERIRTFVTDYVPAADPSSN